MNPNDYILKSITLNTEKFSDFLNMSNEDAGEFIKYLLQYAMDGIRPKMSNAWKQNMYSIYERTITEQMTALDEKRQKATLKAQEREKECKEAAKLLKAEKAKVKSAVQKVSEDISCNKSVSEDTMEDTADVEPEVVSSFDTEISTSSEVNSEVITFAHFVSVLGRRDSNHKYRADAENTWNRMSDDTKRRAMTWVCNYVITYPDVNDRKFPCALVNSRPWDSPEFFS